MDERAGTSRERQDELPEHESDADVAGQAGGGVLQAGGTAIGRGTGEVTGTAQGPAAGTPGPDPTPGILDFTEPARRERETDDARSSGPDVA